MPPKPKSTKRKGKQKEKDVDQPQPEETVDVSIEELLEDVAVSKFASVHNVTDFTKSLRQPGDVAEEEPNADEPENTGAGLDADEFFGFSLEKLRSMRTASCLGCLTMNILDPPIGTKWGHFNYRRVDEDWVGKLTDRFGREKLDHCTDGTTMEIAVRPHWVANLKETLDKVDSKYIHQVDKLELTPIGRQEIMQEKLWVLGGNHRRLALKLHVAKLRVKLERLKEEDVHLRGQDGESWACRRVNEGGGAFEESTGGYGGERREF